MQSHIEPDALVVASDGRLGVVKEVVVRPETDDVAYLVVNRGLFHEPVMVAADAIEAVVSPQEVRLGITRDETIARSAAWQFDSSLATQRDSSLSIPIIEERLVVNTRPVDLGEVLIHLGVATEKQVVSQALTRDDLVVERTPINRPVAEPVAPRQEGEWLVIPIMREELVIQKRLVLAEEVRIRTRQVTHEEVLHETVRRTRLAFEDATVHGVVGLHDVLDMAHETPRSGDVQPGSRTLPVSRDGSPDQALGAREPVQ